MGEPGRFGQAVFCCAGEGDFHGVGQRALVAYRDEERFNICACPDYCSDSFKSGIPFCGICVCKRGMAAFFEGGLFEFSGQSALCTAYCWFVEEQAEVCRQAEATWVCDTLAVDDEDVRLFCEFPGCGDAGRGLAKREQTGNIGESYFAGSADCLYEVKIVEFEHDDGCDDCFSVFTEGTIDACDRFWGAFQGDMADFAASRLCKSLA